MNKVDFTFYGDLLGISNYYRSNPEFAIKKLDRFYNISFKNLKKLFNCDDEITVDLISDSIVISGNKILSAFEQINQLYIDLLHEELLLRGAMVLGRLEFQNRYTINRFTKKLPTSDILARATGLEKSYKGARFLIEMNLFEKFIHDFSDEEISNYYLEDDQYNFRYSNIKNKISNTPDNLNKEILYFVPDFYRKSEINSEISTYSDIKKFLLKNEQKALEKYRIHYSDTINLLNRCELQYNQASSNEVCQ